MNEYQIAVVCGIGLGLCWLLAYLLCWLGQWAWAWVDDSEISLENWLAKRVNFSKWKYPVHNDYGEALKRAAKNGKKPFGWAKEKKHEHKSVGELKHGKEYVYSHERVPGILSLILLSMALPMFVLIAFKLYSVALIILTLMVIAWVARFSRRHKKLFDKHITDKEAHK